MRRLAIVVAGALVASVTLGIGVAQAQGGSKFCSQAQKAFEGVEGFDPDEDLDFDDLDEQFDEAIAQYKKLEKQAPKKLRKPFRTLRKYFQLFGDGGFDFTDPESVEKFTKQAAKVAKASQKIANYLVDECGIDIDALVPDFDVPEFDLEDLPDFSIPDLDN